jgi:hypothetical protein
MGWMRLHIDAPELQSASEDTVFQRLLKELCAKWAERPPVLEDRSADAIKTRWYEVLRDRPQQKGNALEHESQESEETRRVQLLGRTGGLCR